MAQDAVINGTTYPAVESVAMEDENGNVTQYYPDAVRYVEQTLTEDQKAQARENIDALSADDVDDVLEQAKESGEFKGQRGYSILNATSGVVSYTTPVGGVSPKFRIEIAALKEQSLVDDVYVGDSIRYSNYIYPIIYIDDTWVYTAARVTIKGGDGRTPVKGTDYMTDADIEEIVNAVLSNFTDVAEVGM